MQNPQPLPPPNNKHKHLTHPKYRADIDGLRAIAVLSVVCFHAFPIWLKGGFIGVDIFFVISGFLISTIIFENLDKGTFSFTEFYARRIKRIFPALLLVLIACFAFGWFALLADEYKQLGKHIAAGAGFVSNFVLWNESGYFDTAAETKPLLHLWTLGIEEQFYIVWPLLLWAAWKRKFNLLSLTLVITILSFALNIKGLRSDAVATFYSPQTRFWELLIGSTLAYMTLYKPNSLATKKQKLNTYLNAIIYASSSRSNVNTLRNIQAILGATLIGIGLLLITKDRHFPGTWALLPTLGATLIISANSQAWLNRVILSNRVLVWFGLISFPLYLWHWPLLSFARIVESETPTRNIRIAAVVISIALAWLTYKFIEKPIRFGKFSNTRTIILAVLMVVIGSTAYYTYIHTKEKTSDLSKEAKNNCDQHFPDWTTINDNPCLIQPKTHNEIAIIGDSHAGHLFIGMSELLAPSEGVAIFAASGAAPYINVSTLIKPNKTREKNYQLINRAYDYIIADPTIKTVILAHNPICSFNDAVDITNPENKDSNDVLKEGMKRTFSTLIAANKKVIVLFDNPTLPFDPKLCVRRPFRITQKADQCSFSRKIHDTNPANNNYRSLVQSVLINFPQIKTLDLSELLCDKEKCYIYKDGHIIYGDSDHLNSYGSSYIATYLLNFIQQKLN